MVEEEKLTSEFNEAGFQISRLHNAYLQCKYFREKGKLIQCKWILDSIEIELWNDAKRSDNDNEGDDTYISKLKAVNIELNNAIKDKKLSLLYISLVKKEKLLKEIQESSGKGAKYRPIDEDYM